MLRSLRRGATGKLVAAALALYGQREPEPHDAESAPAPARRVAGADFLAPEPESDAERSAQVALWPDALQSFAVFQRCRLAMVGGMTAAYTGIDVSEVRTVLDILDVPRAAWADVLDDVQLMGHAAAAALNQRAQRR